MVLVLIAVVVGVLVGRLVPPGGGRRLALPRLRMPWLLVAGLLATAAADRVSGDAALIVAVAGRGTLLVAVLANLAVIGAGVVAIGLALNLVPLLIDGAIPVRRGALVQAGVVAATDVGATTFDGPRRLERPDDALAALGDAIPLDPLATVVSIGDLVIAVGVTDATAHLVRRRGRRQTEPPTPPHPTPNNSNWV